MATTPRKEPGEVGHVPSDPLQASSSPAPEQLHPSTHHFEHDPLPSDAERRRSHVARRLSALMDQLQSNIFVASQRLNDLTGYSGIEALKRSIDAQEALVQRARLAVRAAKDAYASAIAQRSASQREVNELLQRKHAWSSHDLERFTTLYRSDHANEQAETKAGETLAAAERTAEEAAAKLSQSILARYHEEQIWSDKIRRMSTWGTWGLMGMNIVLFVVFQIAVEPWRRKRLVNGFEEKVREAMERERERDDGGTASAGRVVASLTASSESDPFVVFDDDDSTSGSAHIQRPRRIAVLASNETQTVPLDQANPSVSTSPDQPFSPPSTPTPTPLTTPLMTTKRPTEDTTMSPSTILQKYTHPFLADLFSEKQISLRKVDLTTIALESAAAGATLCAIIYIAILRSSSSFSSSSSSSSSSR